MTETELMARLEKLERDNWRLKRLGVVGLVLATALGLIAATRPVPNNIKARQFDLVDESGQTRAVLKTSLGQATLTFFDSVGRKRVILGGGTGSAGNTYAYLELGEDAATEQLVPTSAGGHGGITLSDGGLTMAAYPPGEMNGSVFLQGPGPDGPALELTDSKGYMISIGATQTVTPQTGATQQTSAASIVMFGNDKKHHVIWQAP